MSEKITEDGQDSRPLAMISQPMRGLDQAEIRKTRDSARAWLESMGYRVADTLFGDFHDETAGLVNMPLFYLAKSLSAMACCEAVLMCPGWKDARGCRIERQAAEEYGLTVLDFDAGNEDGYEEEEGR